MELEEFLSSLVDCDKPLEYISQWYIYNQVSKDYQLIVVSEEYNKAVIYPKGLVNILNKEDTDFVPYFISEKIFFLNTNIIQSMLQSSSVQVPYDYSIMLDTNYASYIKGFVKDFNKPNFFEKKINNTIDALLRNKFNYDYTYYLIENYKNLFSSGERTFTISDSSHIALFDNLYYLELFKSINHKEYISSNKVEFMISENEAKQNTDDLINDIYNKVNNKDGLQTFMDMHQNMTLFLIGIWQIKFGSKCSTKNKMKKLFDFVRNKVGVYYERELIVALKYFEDASSVEMLNQINKGCNQERLLEKIENIAWDFLVPRVMEFHINENKKHSFFIPIFLSHDQKLRSLIKMFKIKGILLHKETNEFIPIPELNSQDLFEEKGLLQCLEMLMSDEVRTERAKVLSGNINNNFEIINNEMERLSQILGK